MKIDPRPTADHVAVRGGLPKAIRPTLLEQTRGDWENNPRFTGKARFFMTIHRRLMDGARGRVRALDWMLDEPEGQLADSVAQTGLVRGAHGLIGLGSKTD